jgi:MFS family permease
MGRPVFLCSLLWFIPATLTAQSPVIPGPQPSTLWITPRSGLAEAPMPLTVQPVRASRRTRWKTGMVAGAVILGVGGAAFGSGLCHGLSEEQSPHCGGATLGMAMLGAFVGGVIGGLIGGAIEAE